MPAPSKSSPASPPVLLVRADAGPAIGLGHAMRCLALAQAWRDQGGGVHWLGAAGFPSSLRQDLRRQGIVFSGLRVRPGSVRDAARTVALARRCRAGWVLLDGYRFKADFQAAIKKAGLQLFCLDDDGSARRYWADCVLNQNAVVAPALYRRRAPGTRLLLGPSYALLRREILLCPAPRRIRPRARRLLICLGGGGSASVSMRLLQALAECELPPLQIVHFIGANEARGHRLAKLVWPSSWRLRLEHDPRRLPEYMAWADVILAGAGVTSLESAFLGLPSGLVLMAKNQLANFQGLARAGAAVRLARYPHFRFKLALLRKLLQDPGRRRRMSIAGRKLVDGQGVWRCLQAMGLPPVRFRPAEARDCRRVWQWANEPHTRRNSFHSEPIPWPTHQAWFNRILRHRSSRLWIAHAPDGNPIGQLRFESARRGEYVLSVGLAPAWRGQGYGRRVIEAGVAELFRSDHCRGVHAYCKPSNPAANRSFAAAGFVNLGVATVSGQPAIHWLALPPAAARSRSA